MTTSGAVTIPPHSCTQGKVLVCKEPCWQHLPNGDVLAWSREGCDMLEPASPWEDALLPKCVPLGMQPLPSFGGDGTGGAADVEWGQEGLVSVWQ